MIKLEHDNIIKAYEYVIEDRQNTFSKNIKY